MSRGFDRIAPYYDGLAQLAFGNSIVACQSHFITHVKDGDSILVVGGGTGVFLPALLGEKKDLHVDFVELSGPMIQRARLRVGDVTSINFFQMSIFEFFPQRKYDAVFLPFILDLFPTAEVEKLAGQVTSLCSPGAKLLVAEFAIAPNSRSWKSLVMKLMYLFFRFTCGITARQMPEWRAVLRAAQWNLEEETLFFHGMMCSFHFAR